MNTNKNEQEWNMHRKPTNWIHCVQRQWKARASADLNTQHQHIKNISKRATALLDTLQKQRNKK